MCYLTCFPGGVCPDLDRLLNSLSSNDDGVGFTIATANGQLITEHAVGRRDTQISEWTDGKGEKHVYTKMVIDKSPMEDLCKRFVKLRNRHPEGPAMFHSRLATGGVEDTRGCHPFKLGGDMKGSVLAHNGIMFSTPAGDWRSDTRIFAEDMLPVKFRKFWRKEVRDRLENYLGNGNKIAIITVNPRFMTRVKGALSKDKAELFIFNEELGHWTKDGAWHSNYSYEAFRSYRSFGTGTSGGWKGHGNFNNTGWDYDDEWSGYGSSLVPGSQDYRDAREADGDAKTCRLCLAIGSVDIFSEVCEVCQTCNGCSMYQTACECYVPRGTTQPANISSYDAERVEPRAITAGSMCGYDPDRPAIESASPDEQRAMFLRDTWDEYENTDDPAVDHMTWEQFVILREYEVINEVEVVFQNLDQMEDWFAEQAAIRSIRDDGDRWSESVAVAREDATKAAELGMEVEEYLAEVDRGDDPGILKSLG